MTSVGMDQLVLVSEARQRQWGHAHTRVPQRTRGVPPVKVPTQTFKQTHHYKAAK